MKPPEHTGKPLKLVMTSDFKRMVWYKGKYLHPDLIDDCEDLFYVHVEPEDLLDFEADQLPHEKINLIFPQKKCLQLNTELHLERNIDKIEMTYSFWFDHYEEPYQGELNPLKIKKRLSKLIKRAGYNTDEDEYAIYPTIDLLPNDNILAVYQKHLLVFEKICRQIVKETAARLNRSLKP
jgi:hypothetical protein